MVRYQIRVFPQTHPLQDHTAQSMPLNELGDSRYGMITVRPISYRLRSKRFVYGHLTTVEYA